MEFRCYTTLPDEAKDIRIRVFCHEQGFQEEFDELDETAVHIVAFEDGVAIGTCRYSPMEKAGEYLIGRIAVHYSYRGKGIGSALVREAERRILAQTAPHRLNGTLFHIGAQVRAIPFYESLGYVPVGERYMDEHVEHQGMEKRLGN